MSRRHLVIALASTASIGIVVAVVMACASLAPSERAKAARPSVPLPHLTASQFTYIADPTVIDSWPSELLVLRKPDGMLRVIRIPTIQGHKALPDVHWWKPGLSCARLEPDFSAQSIYCLDSGLPEWAKTRYRWDLDGKYLGDPGQADSMDMVIGEVIAGDFVFTLGH